MKQKIRSTTVLCVRRGDSVVMAADGQVTLGDSVIKRSARKIRRLYQDKILAGFAGSTAVWLTTGQVSHAAGPGINRSPVWCKA